MLSHALLDSLSALRRFEQKVRAVEMLRHPHIVSCFGAGRLVDGRPYIVMEWVEGETQLAALGCGPLSPDEAAGG